MFIGATPDYEIFMHINNLLQGPSFENAHPQKKFQKDYKEYA